MEGLGEELGLGVRVLSRWNRYLEGYELSREGQRPMGDEPIVDQYFLDRFRHQGKLATLGADRRQEQQDILQLPLLHRPLLRRESSVRPAEDGAAGPRDR